MKLQKDSSKFICSQYNQYIILQTSFGRWIDISSLHITYHRTQGGYLLRNTRKYKQLHCIHYRCLVEAVIDGVERSVAQRNFILVNDRAVDVAEPTPGELVLIPEVQLAMSVLSAITIS